MQNKDFEQLETEHEGMKVVLEFPQNQTDKELVKDINMILSDILQAYLKQANERNLYLNIEKRGGV